jgi:hypothetical protein
MTNYWYTFKVYYLDTKANLKTCTFIYIQAQNYFSALENLKTKINSYENFLLFEFELTRIAFGDTRDTEIIIYESYS